MDNYGKTKEDFVKFFLDELYSKTHFEYEHDPDVTGFFEPDDPYSDHIVASQEHAKKFMKDSICNTLGISADEIKAQYEQMQEEVFGILLPEIEKYIAEKVTVDVKWQDSMKLILNKNEEFRLLGSQKEIPKLMHEENNEIIDIDPE